MSKGYIVTSGWAYLTINGGTSGAISDAKIFLDYESAIMELIDTGLDLGYWDVKEVEKCRSASGWPF